MRKRPHPVNRDAGVSASAGARLWPRRSGRRVQRGMPPSCSPGHPTAPGCSHQCQSPLARCWCAAPRTGCGRSARRCRTGRRPRSVQLLDDEGRLGNGGLRAATGIAAQSLQREGDPREPGPDPQSTSPYAPDAICSLCPPMPTSESQASIISTARLYRGVSTESGDGVWRDGSSCHVSVFTLRAFRACPSRALPLAGQVMDAGSPWPAWWIETHPWRYFKEFRYRRCIYGEFVFTDSSHLRCV